MATKPRGLTAATVEDWCVKHGWMYSNDCLSPTAKPGTLWYEGEIVDLASGMRIWGPRKDVVPDFVVLAPQRKFKSVAEMELMAAQAMLRYPSEIVDGYSIWYGQAEPQLDSDES